MDMTSDSTSPMRLAVIAAITHHAATRPDTAAVLASELASRGYTARSDDELFELAGLVGVAEDKLGRISLLDPTLAQMRPRAVCGRCDDTAQVRVGSRFSRCPACNPPRKEEP